MELTLQILVIFEMLFINISILDSCMKKKRSKFRTYGIILFFSTIAFIMAFKVLPLIPDFGNGSGLFVFFGFLFLPVFYCLYDINMIKLLSILCSIWIYSMIAFVFSVHASILITKESDPCSALCILTIQTIFYLITYIPFTQWVKKVFITILENLTEATNRALVVISLFWFFFIIITNLSFIYKDIIILKIISFALLASNAALTYSLIYYLTLSQENVEALEEIVYKDNLTGILNRAAFFRDANTLIENKERFVLMFMDLNKFKSINDMHGHLIGDEYLKTFATESQALLFGKGTVYRLAGDEFVCIFENSFNPKYTHKLKKHFQKKITSKKIPFIGISFGCSIFPDEAQTLDNLVAIADMNMYEDKKSKGLK